MAASCGCVEVSTQMNKPKKGGQLSVSQGLFSHGVALDPRVRCAFGAAEAPLGMQPRRLQRK